MQVKRADPLIHYLKVLVSKRKPGGRLASSHRLGHDAQFAFLAPFMKSYPCKFCCHPEAIVEAIMPYDECLTSSCDILISCSRTPRRSEVTLTST